PGLCLRTLIAGRRTELVIQLSDVCIERSSLTVSLDFCRDGTLGKLGQRKMQILRFPVQVLREPDVHSRHAHIIRTSWDYWQAGGKPGLSTRGAASSYLDRYSSLTCRWTTFRFGP